MCWPFSIHNDDVEFPKAKAYQGSGQTTNNFTFKFSFLNWVLPVPENIPSAHIYEISDLKYSDKFKRRRVNFVPDFILKLTEESERNSKLCELVLQSSVIKTTKSYRLWCRLQKILSRSLSNHCRILSIKIAQTNGLVKACCCRKIFRSWENFHRYRPLSQRGHKYNRGYHTRFQHKCLESQLYSVAFLNNNNPPASSAVWVIRWIVWTVKTS